MITFLFGAGADKDYGLSEGASFIEPLLRSNYKKERKMLLGDNIGQHQLIYPQSTKVFLQTIASYKDDANKIFGEETVKKLVKYYNIGNKDNDKDELKHFANRFCKKIYDKIKAKQSDEEVKFFLEKAVFFDTLDGKFNDLRNFTLNNNGKRVLNTYATIFISMLKSLYKIDDNFEWKYENVFTLLRKKDNNEKYTKKLKSKDNTYYGILNRHNKKSYNITTTNYTNIVEKVTEKKVVYLHGKLNWFEDYQNLTVYDCLDEKEHKTAIENIDHIMPFILIPSGVKPIICKKEILEFNKFIDQLNNSKILCVVGYSFNSEDNHINSLIAEWLREDHHILVYFNYEKSLNWNNFKWAEPFKNKNISYNDIQSEIHTQGDTKIYNIDVNKSSSLSCFKQFVDIFCNN